ncbi:MAG: signal peptidase I [Candidatus Omnitrophota bacterium]|jgi:hypothetical protein
MHYSKYKLPEIGKEDGLAGPLIYTGISMDPVLKAGDILEVIPYHKRKLRRGDVIAFSSPLHGNKVAHRIVSIRGEEIFTKGDNNKTADCWVLSPADILGRVAYAARGKRRVPVCGWPARRLLPAIFRINCLIKFSFRFLFKPLYYWLSRKGHLRNLWPGAKKAQFFLFNKTNGRELQLFIGKERVGWLPPNNKKWFIKAPFRLFIDETTLPVEPGGARWIKN